MSVDGKKYKGKVTVKFGDDFVKKGSMKLENEHQGVLTAWIFEVGTPYWNNDYTVTVPIRYMITEVHKPGAGLIKEKKRKKAGLRIIK